MQEGDSNGNNRKKSILDKGVRVCVRLCGGVVVRGAKPARRREARERVVYKGIVCVCGRNLR